PRRRRRPQPACASTVSSCPPASSLVALVDCIHRIRIQGFALPSAFVTRSTERVRPSFVDCVPGPDRYAFVLSSNRSSDDPMDDERPSRWAQFFDQKEKCQDEACARAAATEEEFRSPSRRAVLLMRDVGLCC